MHPERLAESHEARRQSKRQSSQAGSREPARSQGGDFDGERPHCGSRKASAGFPLRLEHSTRFPSVRVSTLSDFHSDEPPEIARCYGKSVTPKAITHVFSRTIKPDVKLILDTLAAGGDPEEVMLLGLKKIGGGDGNGQT